MALAIHYRAELQSCDDRRTLNIIWGFFFLRLPSVSWVSFDLPDHYKRTLSMLLQAAGEGCSSLHTVPIVEVCISYGLQLGIGAT